jgi:hypothetical protein
MNSAERVNAALSLELPDRVPVAEFIVDERVARAIMPDMADIYDFMDRIGLDAIAHPLSGPISSMTDAKAYRPPDPNASWRLGDLPEIVSRYKGSARSASTIGRPARSSGQRR